MPRCGRLLAPPRASCPRTRVSPSTPPDGRWPVGAQASGPDRISLSANLPTSLGSGSTTSVSVLARNDDRQDVPAAGPNAVTIDQRWSTAEGCTLQREEVGINELAAMPQ